MKIFKNPNRGKNNHVSQESYTPEYIRLNKEPVIANSSREEFRKPKPNLNIPPQVKVNSGQNTELQWMHPSAGPSNVSPIQGRRNLVLPNIQPEIKEHKYEVVSSFYDEPASNQAVRDFSGSQVESIEDDEVELPPNHYKDELASEGDFTSIQVGEYILMYDNDIIASGDIDEITDIVENILTSDKYNVSIEKITVLKKMNLRTGVLISE